MRTLYLNAPISGHRVTCSDYTGLGFVAREFRNYIFCINIRTYGLMKDFYPYQVQEKNLEITFVRQNSLTLETHFGGFRGQQRESWKLVLNRKSEMQGLITISQTLPTKQVQ